MSDVMSLNIEGHFPMEKVSTIHALLKYLLKGREDGLSGSVRLEDVLCLFKMMAAQILNLILKLILRTSMKFHLSYPTLQCTLLDAITSCQSIFQETLEIDQLF